MSQENVQIVKRIHALVDSGDIEAAVAHFDPDIEWRDVSAEDAAGPLRGIAELRASLAQTEKLIAAAVASRFVPEIEDYIDAGDYVVTVTHIQLGLDLQPADVYEFKDGKVWR